MSTNSGRESSDEEKIHLLFDKSASGYKCCVIHTVFLHAECVGRRFPWMEREMKMKIISSLNQKCRGAG